MRDLMPFPKRDETKPIRVAVTGSAGYIGSHLTPVLIASGYEVIDIDLVTGHDLRDGPGLALPPCDVVVHLAAKIDARASKSEQFDYYDTNIAGSLNVFRAMAAVGCNRMVFASSAMALAPESSAYAASKRVIESMLYTMNTDVFPFTFLALRFFNVCGGRERHRPETHLIPRAVAAAFSGTPLTVYNEGRAKRDYIHVADVCQALRRSVKCVMTYPLNGAMDIGTGISTTTAEIVAKIEAATGRAIAQVPGIDENEPMELLCNPAQARVILEWRHSRTLDEAIAEAITDYLAASGTLGGLDKVSEVLQFRPGAQST